MGTNAGRCTQLAILSLVVLTARAALRAGELSTVEESLLAEARAALSRAATYFRSRISTRGSYLWSYSSDLKQRRGEREATATQGWVQPPGTPSVGMAYLDAYEATRDRLPYLEAQRLAGLNLLLPPSDPFALQAITSGDFGAREELEGATIPVTLLHAIGWIESRLNQARLGVPYEGVGPVLISPSCAGKVASAIGSRPLF